MSHRQIRSHCVLDEAGQNLLRATMTELGLSRCLRGPNCIEEYFEKRAAMRSS